MQYRLLWAISLFAALAPGVAVSGGRGVTIEQSRKSFSTSGIHGSYGISYIVALTQVSAPTQFLSGTGVLKTDGAGHLTGEETTNTNGQVCSGTLNGTYTVSADGTGALSMLFAAVTPGCSDVSIEQTLVILDSGRIVRVADTMPGEVTIFEEWQKQM